jgi:glyoxylase-like metal-dependent hydrolase (beta-lactamase superfamily II)
MTAQVVLPPGVTVFERGWLSSNNVLFVGRAGTALVDSGYCSHAAQTVALTKGALEGQALDQLLCTHLHSDHCGGNAALQAAYPGMRTLIPPGLAQAVSHWNESALSYEATGQRCDRFQFDGLLRPGIELSLGDAVWQVHAAPGHDAHSVILFEPMSRTLISADALWENGFGVVFPELEGEGGFSEVAATLDAIERLSPCTVIPGHGRVFGGADGVATALALARSRLSSLAGDPKRHAAHAMKVLIKFKLLEWRRIPEADFSAWAERTPYFGLVHTRYFAPYSRREWLDSLLVDLVRSQAIGRTDGMIFNL